MVEQKDLTLEDNLRERLQDLESKVLEFGSMLHEWDIRYKGVYDIIQHYEKFFNLSIDDKAGTIANKHER